MLNKKFSLKLLSRGTLLLAAAVLVGCSASKPLKDADAYYLTFAYDGTIRPTDQVATLVARTDLRTVSIDGRRSTCPNRCDYRYASKFMLGGTQIMYYHMLPGQHRLGAVYSDGNVYTDGTMYLNVDLKAGDMIMLKPEFEGRLVTVHAERVPADDLSAINAQVQELLQKFQNK